MNMIHSEKTYLKAHVAARVIYLPPNHFDQYDLPTKHKAPSKLTVRKAFARIASYLKTKIPLLFQECQAVIEERESAIFFTLENINNTRGVASEQKEILLSAPLTSLVDVSVGSSTNSRRDTASVASLEQIKVVDDNYHRSPSMSRSAHSESIPRRSGPMPTLFRAHDNSSVSLVFAAIKPETDENVFTRSFTKVSMRFAHDDDCAAWTSFCRAEYITLLLDGIREGCCRSTLSSEAKMLPDLSSHYSSQRPALSQEMIDSYIDFFQCDSIKASTVNVSMLDSTVQDQTLCNGQIYIVTPDGTRSKIYISMERHTKCERHCSTSSPGLLVFYKKKRSSRYSKHRSAILRVPTSDITIFVDKNLNSGVFFIQYRNFNVASGQHADAALSTISTIHLDAITFSNRCKWLKWFDFVMNKEPVYLPSHKIIRYNSDE